MMSSIPISLKLTISSTVMVAAVLSSAGVIVYRFMEKSLFQSVDVTLMATASSIRDSKELQNDFRPNFNQLLAEFFGEKSIHTHGQIVDFSGNIRSRADRSFLKSLPVSPKSLKRAEKGLETFETFAREGKQPSLRQLTLPVMTDGRFTGEIVQVATLMDGVEASLRQAATILWIMVPVTILMAFVFAFFLAKSFLASVGVIQKTVARMGTEDLSKRLALPRAKDELHDLVLTFNGLLEKLEDALMRQRRFSADVSHELRTPIAVMRAEAELSLRKIRNSDEYKASLNNILTECLGMGQTIEDLLLFAKADAKRLVMQKSEICIDTFLQDLAADPTHQNLLVEVGELPTKKLRVASNYFSIALKNLISNAFKHSPHYVKLLVEQKSNFWEFSVIDHGDGIAPEAIPYIFDPFFRADTARNRTAGGVGIGLTLAKAMIRLHEGTLEVTSTPGAETIFRARIPV